MFPSDVLTSSLAEIKQNNMSDESSRVQVESHVVVEGEGEKMETAYMASGHGSGAGDNDPAPAPRDDASARTSGVSTPVVQDQQSKGTI